MAKLAAYAQYQANQQNQVKSKTGKFHVKVHDTWNVFITNYKWQPLQMTTV